MFEIQIGMKRLLLGAVGYYALLGAVTGWMLLNGPR